ncbi:GNAT family N-acetyltransferase [Streptomyces sp. TRM68416]|uniref:GNAT family N-acetyltransferase n=1 Tax=Streptomyces sp. TRM68416 TaxID=2758412 RepID=UPI001661CFA4|nr:GNAT family N-acetyltransferase [Streptomyces sp. TRM68416]MBD0843273.1 GNAT family N-acetyltransferase [Streptomyces sp. TRM68416]
MSHDTASGQTSAIRPRTDDDIAEAATALVAVHATDGYPVEGVDDPEAWLTPPDLLGAWVAVLDQQVVGHVALSRPHGEDAVRLYVEQSQEPETRVAVLARLFVHPEARGHSLGEQLVREATQHAYGQGLRLVGDVMTKDKAAIRLYERLGCQIIGSTMHTYGNGEEIPAVCFVAPGP